MGGGGEKGRGAWAFLTLDAHSLPPPPPPSLQVLGNLGGALFIVFAFVTAGEVFLGK